jgi:phage tail-like protein
MLPAVFREDQLSASFLERFLAVFQHDWDDLETKLEQFRLYLDPAQAPDHAALHYLAAWFDIRLESEWTLERARQFLACVLPLRTYRGTPAAAEAWLQAWLQAEGWPNAGRMPRLVEGFRVRRFFALGNSGRARLPRGAPLAYEPFGDVVRLDSDARLDEARLLSPQLTHPEQQVLDNFGHRVRLYVCDVAESKAGSAYWDAPPEVAVQPDPKKQSKMRRLLRAAQDVLPGSLTVDFVTVSPGFRMGADSILGLNTILAGERGD